MTQRILSCLFLILAVTVSCKEDAVIKTFNALVVVSDSELVDEKYAMVTLYSSDGGQTFVDYPIVKEGETYKAMVVHRDGSNDLQIVAGNCYAVDWSASDPAPNSSEGGIAEFTMNKNNAINAVVTNTYYKPYDAGVWAGDWIGVEDGTCCNSEDANTIRQDTSDPNKFIMDNFWGDDVDAYFVFTPSTNKDNQVVTLPEQTTSEGGVAKGVGTYDMCTNTFMLATSYKLGGKTYVFDYYFALK